jgi:hypothetical protein
MKCSEVKYYLNDYADGHLINEMRDDIKNHLDVCLDCKSYYDDILIIISKAKTLPKEITPTKDLWEGISERISGKKKSVKIFAINKDEDSLYESGERKTLFFKLPRKRQNGWFIIGTVASVVLGIVLGVFYYLQSSSTAFWIVEKLAGNPTVGSEELTDHGMLKVGDWLETDNKSSARLKVGIIGEVDVKPKSRVKLVETNQSEYRISLDKGRIEAAIWAPPKLFFVETPSATAIDLGCMYTLEVSEDGSGLLKVTSGWVALQSGELESLIPSDAVCKTKKTYGPGTPYFEDATENFKKALEKFDFSENKSDAFEIILRESRKEDLLSLWHILSKVKDTSREKTFNRIFEFVNIPVGITSEGIMNGNKEMMDILWESLGYGSKSLWNYL